MTNSIILKIKVKEDRFPVENKIEIREFKNKLMYIDLIKLQKDLCKNSLEINNLYISNFDSSILIDYGFNKKEILIIIDQIEEIDFVDDNIN